MRRYTVLPLTTFVVLFFLLLTQMVAPVLAATYTYNWSAVIRGTPDNDFYLNQSAAIDSDNNIYTTGTFYGTVDFDPTAGTDNVVANVSGSGYVSKVTETKAYVWTKNIGTNIFPKTIFTDSADNLLIHGVGNGTVDFDPGPGTQNRNVNGGPFTLKLDQDGNFVWVYVGTLTVTSPFITTTFGEVDSGDNIVEATEVFDNDTFVTNTTVSRVNSSGSLIWTFDLVPEDEFSNVRAEGVTTLADNSVILAGSYDGDVDFDPGAGTSIPDYGGFTMFVAKYSAASGALVWVRTYNDGLQSIDYGDLKSNVVTSSANNIMIVGTYAATSDFDPGPGTVNFTTQGGGSNYFITQLDAAGLYVNTRVNNSVNFIYSSIMPKSDGGFYVSGTMTSGVSDLDPTAGTDNHTGSSSGRSYVSEYESDLDYVNSYTPQGSGRLFSYGSNLSEAGGTDFIVLAGQMEGTVDFDGGVGTDSSTTVGTYDGYVYTLTDGGVAPTNTPVPTATNTPTPTGAPTSTPAPTAVPSSGGSSSSQNSEGARSTTEAPTCQATVPVGKPDLFQINRKGKSAILYFTPASDNVGSYHVIYGFKEGNEQFGALSLPSSGNKGVQTLTINELDPKVNYWFKVAPVNGCAVGKWSDWLRMGQQAIIYKYLPRV